LKTIRAVKFYHLGQPYNYTPYYKHFLISTHYLQDGTVINPSKYAINIAGGYKFIGSCPGTMTVSETSTSMNMYYAPLDNKDPLPYPCPYPDIAP
jgi:hypothetical protein